MSRTESAPRLFGAAEVCLGRQRSPQHETGPHMLPYLRAANIKDGTLDLTDVKSMNFEPSEQKTFALQAGDILITEGSGSLAAIGASAVWKDDLPGPICFQNTLIRLRPRPGISNDRYLGWWARSAYASGQFASISSGANIYHLSAERVKTLPAPLPSLDEQRRIADFLDAETAHLTYLAEKIKMTSELSDERFKVELGKAFDDYSTGSVRLKFLLCEPLRYGANAAAEHENPSWPRYIRITDIDSYGKLRDDSFKSLDPGEARPYLLRDRDVLFARSGATVGKSFMYRNDSGPACFAGYLIRARFPENSFLPEAISYFTMTENYWQQIEGDTIQATIQNVSAERYGNIMVPYLPDEAQSKLVGEFTDRYESHRRLAALTSRQLALLAERRQALITAAVTGQIDVTTARGVSPSGGTV